MARTRSDVDKLRRQVITHLSKALNNIYREKRIDGPHRTPDPFEVGAKPRIVLHRTDSGEPGVSVDQSDKLIQIDTSVAFRTHSQFDAVSVADHSPRIKV